MTGAVLWSQREQVSYKQCAWTDEITFRVPVVGEYDREKAYFALNRKLHSPGHIAGSSYGACSVSLGEYDAAAKTVLVMLSFGIGD